MAVHSPATGGAARRDPPYLRRMTTPVPEPGVVGAVPTPLANGAGPRRGALPRALVILIGAAAVVVVVAGIQATAWLIGPAFMALIVVIAVAPVHGWLRRHGWPGWATTLVLILLVYGILLGLALGIIFSVGPPGDRAAPVRVEGQRPDELGDGQNWPRWAWDPSSSSRPRAR